MTLTLTLVYLVSMMMTALMIQKISIILWSLFVMFTLLTFIHTIFLAATERIVLRERADPSCRWTQSHESLSVVHASYKRFPHHIPWYSRPRYERGLEPILLQPTRSRGSCWVCCTPSQWAQSRRHSWRHWHHISVQKTGKVMKINSNRPQTPRLRPINARL